MTLRAALVLVCMAGTNACVTRISSDLVRTELATEVPEDELACHVGAPSRDER